MLRLKLRKSVTMSSGSINYPQGFVDFLNATPTPYHAVFNMKEHLKSHGFKELSERESWKGKVKPQGKWFVTRNNSSIIAFVVGGKWKPGNPFAITGGHTDSPVLKIKPISKRTNEHFQQIGVECYGGGIWHSWFDADLAIAGRVFVKDSSSNVSVAKLVDLKKPLLKIPTLAIHLDRDVNQKFEFNKETQLLPIAGLAGDKPNSCGAENAMSDSEFASVKSMVERHHEDLLRLVARELSLKHVSDIEDFELTLYDHKPSCLGGLKEEFVFSGRLDNLTTCFTSLIGFTEAANLDIENEEGIRMMSCFDHEEVGSSSAQGADSNFLPNIMERLVSLDSSQAAESLLESYAKSFFLSSDVAHGIHPNYSGKYESNHKPLLGKGPVIKINANQRYMTNSPGFLVIKKLADAAQIPLQLFVVANNSPCGSTIGPILASKTGMRTLDIGNPVLSMHSIRETGAAADIDLQIKLFKAFFSNYSSVETQVVL
ncbi:LAMI_0E13586g1_1 [Lachancea mirantina]|uniref:aspartyl aminopeptidase n=1 Tax=Lachancea mirantina TaxID=1230905 RepID=A0A1G4JQY7_9SACH|nr:LAMI_0E13586g1_1 [Lachancea mirantina]